MRSIAPYVTLLLLAACSSSTVKSELEQSQQSVITDEDHGGEPGFRFGRGPTSGGQFAAYLSPEVRIDRINPRTGATLKNIAKFTATTHASVRVFPHRGFYLVRWDTSRYHVDARAIYRIRVLVEGRELGFADVDIVRNGREFSAVDKDNFFALKKGAIMPIKFWIGQAAVDQDGDEVVDWQDNCPSVANPPARRPSVPWRPHQRARHGCDPDLDGCDPDEHECRTPSKSQTDTDGDGTGDACECLNVTCDAVDECHEAGVCEETTGACSSPPREGDCESYWGLPIVAVHEGEAAVGPEGAHIQFSDDLTLDIPAGALSEVVLISARFAEPLPQLLAFGDPVAPVVELQPDGLGFELPVRLTTTIPREDGPQVIALSTSSDEVVLEPLAFSVDAGGTIRMWLEHFSQVGAFRVDAGDRWWVDLTVPGTVARAAIDASSSGACSTGAVLGLTRQILNEFHAMLPDVLVPATGIFDSRDPLGTAWVQRPVSDALLAATTGSAVPPGRLGVQSAWRSLAQQFVLWRCGRNAAARPGNSPHGDGRAIDVSINDRSPSKQNCTNARTAQGATHQTVLDATVPGWGRALEEQRLYWYGSSRAVTSTQICSDPVHFEAAASAGRPQLVGVEDLRVEGLRAFRRLWNRHRPCAYLPEHEPRFDHNTAVALMASPADGFPSTPPVVPPEGLRVEACRDHTPLCCPAGDLDDYFCSDVCPDPNACQPMGVICVCTSCFVSGFTEFCAASTCAEYDTCSPPPVDCRNDDVHP